MAGEFSRVGNTRAENISMMASMGQIGDVIAALSAATGTGAITSLATAASGGGAILTKAIPTNCIVSVGTVGGPATSYEYFLCTAGAALSATSIAITSQTVRATHLAGEQVSLVSFAPYLALITATTAPTDTTLGSEYSKTGYARQPITWTAPTAADPPVTSNNGAITFGPVSGANGSDVITYAALMDALSGGAGPNQYMWWTLTATRTPNAGDSLQIASAALTGQSFH